MALKKTTFKKMAAAVEPDQELKTFLIKQMDRFGSAFEFNSNLKRIFRVRIVGEKWYFYALISRKFYVI